MGQGSRSRSRTCRAGPRAVVVATALAVLAACGAPPSVSVVAVGIYGNQFPFDASGSKVLSSVAIFSDGTDRWVDASLQSSDPAIATVDASGKVTRVSAGDVLITATYEGVAGAIAVQVP